jgi:hypothetical protein
MSKTIEIDDIEPAPWDRGQWSGEFFSVDGCLTSDFTRDDVVNVIAWGEDGDEWDGGSAGIVLLKDGRYAAWYETHGPTGDGFHEDAYGGDADILFAKTEAAAREALGGAARLLAC